MRFATTNLLCLVLGLVLLGCGDSGDGGSAGSCEETICTAGEALCQGNSVWICADDGLSWNRSGCGLIKSCVNGACADRACLDLGVSNCIDASGGTRCAADGLESETFSCGVDDVCAGGQCVSSSCTDDDVACGSRATLLCNGGAWEATDCAGGELCVWDDSAGTATCAAPACDAATAWCDGNTAHVCDFEGRIDSTTECGSGEVCDGGWCRAATCSEVELGYAAPTGAGLPGSTVGGDGGDGGTGGAIGGDGTGGADAGGGTASDAGVDDAGGATEPDDPGPFPGLEPISKIEFKLAGIPNTFDVNARADYVFADSNLKISGAASGRKIEMNFLPIDQFVLGDWNDTDGSEVVIVVCYHDGSANQTPPDGAGCSVGFSHASILYSGSLTNNNGPGSRVIGTFAATLLDAAGTQLEISEGSFDVLHK